jgi:hypothetical protein
MLEDRKICDRRVDDDTDSVMTYALNQIKTMPIERYWDVISQSQYASRKVEQ